MLKSTEQVINGNTECFTHTYTHTHLISGHTQVAIKYHSYSTWIIQSERRNKTNANAHKIIQLQNIKTKLWLIISRPGRERERARHYLYLHLNAKYKQLFKRTETEKSPSKLTARKGKHYVPTKRRCRRRCFPSLSGSSDNFHISKNHNKKGARFHRRNSFISMQRADRIGP